ncbi:MAG: insulinase family protein [Candidatus Omnitrophica bacterium]|nr:insulinase family protein [Candidatus Omnitrophota bacterium]
MIKRLTLSALFCAAFLAVLPLHIVFSAEQQQNILKDGLTRKTVLDNGLTVILRYRPNSELVACQYWVKTGSAYEGSYLGSGISHFIEHMIFKGSEDHSTYKVAEAIEQLGGHINAFTSQEATNFYVKIPHEHLEKGLSFLADALQSAGFPEGEIIKEREVILREMNMTRDDPSRELSRLLWQTAFLHHSYRYPIIGDPALLKKITRQDLLTYYHSRYAPNNSVLVIVGEINFDSVLPAVQKTFGQFAMNYANDIPLSPEPTQLMPRSYEKTFDGTTTHAAFAFHSVALNHQDLFALDVLATVLGSGNESRLYKRLVKKEQLAYDVDCWNHTPRDKGLFGITFVCEPENYKRVSEIIWDEIAAIQKEELSSKEIEKAQNQILARFLYGKESPEGQAEDCAYGEILSGTPLFSTYYIDGISRISAREVKAIASTYLLPQRLNRVALIPQYYAETIPASVERSSAALERNLVHYVMPNGVRLIIQEDHTLPITSIACVFLGGIRLETGVNNGLINLLADMMLQGTHRYSSEEIFELVESQGGILNSYGGYNSFGISLKALSKNTAESLDLLGEILQNPSFPDEELSISKKRIAGQIRLQEEDVFYEAFSLTRKELFQKHPYSLNPLGTLQSVEALSRDDVRAAYAKYVVPENTVICIVGDVETEKVRALVEQCLRSWKQRAFEEPRIPDWNFPKKAQTVTQKTNKSQSIVITAFPGTQLSSKDRYSLELISRLLSGNSGRLFEAIREESGAAYTLGALSIPGIDTGFFALYCATKTDKIDWIQGVFKQELETLRSTPPDEHELETTKKAFLSLEAESFEKTQDRALRFALDELYGMGYDYYLKVKEIVSTITPQDIQKAAQTYFIENNSVRTVLTGKE